MSKTEKTISEIIKNYFAKNPNRDITQSEVVDYVFKFIPKTRDPWRAVRKLYEEGYLIQVKKGVYRREPGYKGFKSDEPFPPEIKEKIFKRDNYRCILCENGPHNGYEIHADHITPRSKGGLSIVSNGQTLCSEHNLMKKKYGTTDFLTKYSHKMLEIARANNDKKVENFFLDILKVIEKHKM